MTPRSHVPVRRVVARWVRRSSASPWPRRATVLAGLLLVFAVAIRSTPVTSNVTDEDRGDAALFTAIADRMAAGQTYYEASGIELRKREYPTRSIFNWRQPLVFHLVASVGERPAQLMLLGLAFWLVLQTGRFLHWKLAALLAMCNATLMMEVPRAPVFTEVWAGGFLGLSALYYAQRRDRTGAAWALAALFVRELAAPYCVLAAAIAVWQRRRRELVFWAAGGALYVLYYGWHAWQATRHIRPDDFSHAESWLSWGGLPFLLETWRYNGLFLVTPVPIFALSVVGVAAAAWAPRMPLHIRASIVLYSACFLAIGQPFNGYWGFLTAPLIALWLAYAPAGLRALWTPGRAHAPAPVEPSSLIERAITRLRARP